ncbi:hypothetical protein, partial [uncultured Porphyromonas sp.]|uniref:hypothetical protein n=1 Tax=uncultured Porphyromonas sp. TaxID=159274 RepID=UPI0028046CB9
RSFAPPTGGYDSSDRKRSLPSSPALALLYDNGTSSDISGRSSRIALLIKTLCAPIRFNNTRHELLAALCKTLRSG